MGSQADSNLFRAAMRRVSGAVTIVTTCTGEGDRRGVTATAICSLTVDPPAVLACINRSTWVGQTVPDSGIFCVNVLSQDQQDLAETFAGRAGLVAGERFSMGDWRPGDTGAPVLAGALASFDCRLTQAVEFSTHVILIGEVVGTHLGPDAAAGAPLLYCDGTFTTTQRDAGQAV